MTEQEIRDELAAVNAAMTAIRDGAQSYGTQGRSVTKVSYETLLKQRKDLQQQLDAITGANVTLVGWRGQ